MKDESTIRREEQKRLGIIGQGLADAIETVAITFCKDAGRTDPSSVVAAALTMSEAALFLLLTKMLDPDDQVAVVREMSISLRRSLAGWQAEQARRNKAAN